MADENILESLFESHEIVTRYLYIHLLIPFELSMLGELEEFGVCLLKHRDLKSSTCEICLEFSAMESQITNVVDIILWTIRGCTNPAISEEENFKTFHSTCESKIPLLAPKHNELVFDHATQLPEYFKINGFSCLKKAIPEEILTRTRDVVNNHISQLLSYLAVFPPNTDIRFKEIMMRDEGRYDAHLSPSQIWNNEDSVFWELEASWLDSIRHFLGDDFILCKQGVVFSTPGTKKQYWHADGPESCKPYQAICCFVPLVDLTEKTGYTCFWPGTHLLKQRQLLHDSNLPAHLGETGGMVKGFADCGDVLLYDYKTIHQGQANNSEHLRPILYLVYSKPGFQEKNFALASLQDMQMHDSEMGF